MSLEVPPREPAFSAGKLWPVAAGSFIAVLGLAYGLRGGTEDRDILTNQHTLSVSVHQLRQQVKDLSERLAALNALHEERALIIEPPAAQPATQRDKHPFQLMRSTQFRRAGPVSLALRKVDTKHKRYDIDLLINGVKLEKRNVNLYEPVVHTAGGQTIELVATEIARDRIGGYLSQTRPQRASR